MYLQILALNTLVCNGNICWIGIEIYVELNWIESCLVCHIYGNSISSCINNARINRIAINMANQTGYGDRQVAQHSVDHCHQRINSLSQSWEMCVECVFTWLDIMHVIPVPCRQAKLCQNWVGIRPMLPAGSDPILAHYGTTSTMLSFGKKHRYFIQSH